MKLIDFICNQNFSKSPLLCTYWNQSLDGKILLLKLINFYTDGYGDWSNKGCNTSNSGLVVYCECNHLTNFAILLVMQIIIID